MTASLLGAATATPIEVEPSDRGYRWAAVALTLVPVATHLARLLTTSSRWQVTIYEDDAYYYLAVARSLAHGDGSTFTGLTLTNGYHPLWALLLVPLAALFRSTNSLLLAVGLLQGVLWALGVREALRIGRLIGCWRCAAGAVSVYAVLAVMTGRLSFNGMESALLLPLLLLVVRLGLESEGSGDRPADDWRLGVVLALVCLTRLDAVTAAIPLGLLLVLRTPGTRQRLRRAVRLAVPAAVALGGYMVVNQVLFDSPTPVSGRAKQLGAPFLNVEPLVQFLGAGDVVGHHMFFGVAALALVAVAWWTGVWRHDRRLSFVMACAVTLVVGQLLLVAYLVFFTSYPVWPWYHYQLAILSFCAALVVARWGVDRFGELAVRACLVAAGGFLVVQALVVFRPEDRPYPSSISGSVFVQENLPADAVLAMGDRAGIFGFVSDRPLLHLEGLMADAGYLDAFARGEATRRMAEEGVDYYVRYGSAGDRIMVDGQPCERIEEPFQGEGPKFSVVVCDEDEVFAAGADRGFRIWRYRPELNRP